MRPVLAKPTYPFKPQEVVSPGTYTIRAWENTNDSNRNPQSYPP